MASDRETSIPRKSPLLNCLRRWWSGGPCDRCGVEGGIRWPREEKVGNRIIKRSVCDACSKSIFFYGYRDLPEREWVR